MAPSLVFCLAAITDATFSCHAGILVQGGTAPQRAWIEQTYRHDIPSPFRRAHPVFVRLLTDDALNASVTHDDRGDACGDQGTIDGITQGDPPVILLRATRPEAEIQTVFAHEYGHVVWNSLLSTHQRTAYLRIYAVDRDEHHLISAYAEVSPEEGFAEAFSEFVLHARHLDDIDPRSYDFLSALSNAGDKNRALTAQGQEWEERDPAH